MGHDQIFKDLLRAFFYEFLLLFLPQLAAAIDPSSISMLQEEVFTDIPSGQRRTVDLAASVRLPEGDPDVAIVHVEIQRDEPPTLGHRIWEYNALIELREGHTTVSVVFLPFAATGGLALVRYSETLGGQEYARLDYWRIAVRSLPTTQYLAPGSVLGAALAALMRPPDGDRVSHRIAILEMIDAARLDDARQYLLVNLVQTYLELNATEQAEYNRRLQVEGKTAVETLELTWGERKVLEGRAQGLEEGARQARREAVRDVIRTRFGAVPADLEARIAQAEEPELTQLLQRAALAVRIEDLNS
jgi:hypothetical protein